jgi:hypothetical protein
MENNMEKAGILNLMELLKLVYGKKEKENNG